MEKFIVSARKYRPNKFENLIGQGNIVETLKNSILKNQLAHAYLFCGPRGVGKTTSARIFAKTINCLNPSEKMDPCGKCESCLSFGEGRSYCIHELDAASNNSVEDIRLLNEKVRIPPQIGKYSVYIIDEVHMLSPAAFNAFLKTLEEPPAYAVFILATTEKHKIIPTILSRCQVYDFNRISVIDIVSNLKSIAEKEGVSIEEEAMHIIANKADGAMRDALTLFDQSVAFCGNNITYSKVIHNLNVLDYEYYFKLTQAFLNGDYSSALNIFDEILFAGFNALHFIGGLSKHFRDLLISKTPNTVRLLELSPSIEKRYSEQAQLCSFDFLYNSLKITNKCEIEYRQSGNQRLLVEFALVQLSKAYSTSPSENKSDHTYPQENTQKLHAIGDRFKSTSLKSLRQKAEEEKTTVAPLVKKEIGNRAFTTEELEEAWLKMADSERNMPRLAMALSTRTPIISNENTVVYLVENDVQQNWIMEKCHVRLLQFLKEKLDNNSITLEFKTAPVDENNKEGKLYMPSEKAKFLLEKYPELRKLHNELKLEVK